MKIRSRTIDTTPSLRTVSLRSADPSRLRSWYEQAFGASSHEYGPLELGGGNLLFEQKDDIGTASAEPGRFTLSVDVADVKAAAERIEHAGTTWSTPLTEDDGVHYAVAADPDGNQVTIVQVKPELQKVAAEASRAARTVTEPFCGFAVDDTVKAMAFYTDVLGLDVTEQNDLLAIWLTPTTSVLAYPKEGHVPAQHTILNIPVDDIDDTVASLVEAGVQMLHYDGFGQDDRCIVRGEKGPPIAWFTDPAGNILSVLQLG